MAKEERPLNGYDDVIMAYDREAAALAERYDALPEGAALSEVAGLLPTVGLALDVGAGSGRDARWLERRGLEVVAIEPSQAFRAIGAAANATVRWVDDRLPSLDKVHALAVSFDLITLSAVWQHVAPGDRQRAFRKLATLMRPGGILVLTLRAGPAPADRPMHPTSSGEIEGLARTNGMEILKVGSSADLQGRGDVSWTTMVLRMPDDGAGALPLVRGIALGDDKSSTYKLGLLRAVARVAEQSPAAALPASDGSDSVEIPLGLVALNWLRMYLPLVRLGLPQAPRNSGPDGLGFAKAGFRSLVTDGTDAQELRVGAVFDGARATAVASAIGEAAATIATMPANFTRFPNSDTRVFKAARARPGRTATLDLSLERLKGWGHLSVPGHLWRALSRYGPWIEPMLVSEWARLMRTYADRMGLPIAPGVAEVALEWREPIRTTSIARLAAERLVTAATDLECVWTGRRLRMTSLDIDHCLPWSAWPCGDLWNLAPCDRRVNQHEKRDRLPSARATAQSRERLIRWWRTAYLDDHALRGRFIRETGAALPLSDPTDAAEVYAAFDWRRLRMSQDQRLPEWTPVTV